MARKAGFHSTFGSWNRLAPTAGNKNLDLIHIDGRQNDQKLRVTDFPNKLVDAGFLLAKL